MQFLTYLLQSIPLLHLVQRDIKQHHSIIFDRVIINNAKFMLKFCNYLSSLHRKEIIQLRVHGLLLSHLPPYYLMPSQMSVATSNNCHYYSNALPVDAFDSISECFHVSSLLKGSKLASYQPYHLHRKLLHSLREGILILEKCHFPFPLNPAMLQAPMTSYLAPVLNQLPPTIRPVLLFANMISKSLVGRKVLFISSACFKNCQSLIPTN